MMNAGGSLPWAFFVRVSVSQCRMPGTARAPIAMTPQDVRSRISASNAISCPCCLATSDILALVLRVDRRCLSLRILSTADSCQLGTLQATQKCVSNCCRRTPRKASNSVTILPSAASSTPLFEVRDYSQLLAGAGQRTCNRTGPKKEHALAKHILI